MSFGFGISDFISVGNLAWQVYKSCKEAPGSFKNVSQEVLSLHAVLKEIEEVLEGHNLSTTRKSRLATITEGCCDILRDLQTLVTKYESLGSKTKRTWDRLNWHSDDIAELRARLTSNIGLLTVFVSTSQIIVERQLNKFVHEYQDGKHEPSVVTTMTAESLSMDEKQLWRSIRKELEDIGISVTAFNANKDFILAWFQDAVKKGAFLEQSIDEDSDSDLFEGNLPLSLADLSLTTKNLNTEGVLLDLDEEQTKIEEYESLQTEEKSLDRPQTTSKQSVTIEELPTQMPESTILEPNHDTIANEMQMTQRKTVIDQLIEIDSATRSRNLSATDSHLEVVPAKNRTPRIVNLISRLLGHERALFKAVSRGDLPTFKKLISDSRFAVESRDTIKMELLIDAISFRRVKMVVVLLDHVDIKANAKGGFPLHVAVTKNDKEIVKLLLEKGASIYSTDTHSNTPLHIAAEICDLDLVLMLIVNHAPLNPYNRYGVVPLVSAAASGRSEIVQLLLMSGADPNRSNMSENTPLGQAASAGDDAIVKLLLGFGANVNRHRLTGKSALAKAVQHGQESTVKLLLDNGADPDSLPMFGESLISHAKVLHHGAIVRLLLSCSMSSDRV